MSQILESEMRTDQEIIERINSVKEGDWLGTQQSDLIACLSFGAARPYLKDGVTEDEWKPLARDRDSVITRMLDYMPFAWDKANNERGLSAGRSMDHYQSWVWLAGDDLGDLTRYQYYGKENLCRICEKYGWDAKQWDNGERNN